MPNHKSFQAPLVRVIDAQALAVPDVDAAAEDEFEGNAYYMDLRGFRLVDAASVLQKERSVVACWQESGVLPDLEEDDSGDDPLQHLDIGVASAVVALSAAGACLLLAAMLERLAEHTAPRFRSSAFLRLPTSLIFS